MNPEPLSLTKSAWIQLYEARRQAPPTRTRPRGRPPRVTPRRSTLVHLTDGERTEIDSWQARISLLLGRKVSLGETVGILARVCSARLPLVERGETSTTLAKLVRLLVGE